MTMDPNALQFGDAKEEAKRRMKELGLNPSIMDMIPSSIITREQMKELSPGAFGVYAADRKRVYLTSEAQNSPSTYLHEYFHALQDSLKPQDKQTLESIMALNPPEGQQNTGFTNYPGGRPTQHHPVNQGVGGWGLSSYVDYIQSQGAYTPYAEEFHSSTDKPWHRFPDPIINFLRERFPALPQKQVNNWNLEDIGNNIGKLTGQNLQ